MSLVLRLPRKMHLARGSTCPTPAIAFRHATKPSRFAHFGKVHNPLRLPRKTTSERPKVIRTPLLFYTFDLEMCFAPQQRPQNLTFGQGDKIYPISHGF